MVPTLHRQRGAIAIMAALALLVLLSLVGLIVDGGLAYMTKARLNAAVDSAALAAARAVTIGNNQAEQRASAQAAASRFFDANIPQGYLLSKPKLLGTDVTFDGGMVTIDVRAEAPMPVSLMQMTGVRTMAPGAAAQTIRRDLDMAFVVDTSGSLKNVQAQVRTSAKSFLNKFNVTQDRVSLIHFASGAEVDNAINQSARGFNRTSMLRKIDAFNFEGGTSSIEGMWHARSQLASISAENRSTLRVIVFFSDGAPTSFGATVGLKYPNDCPLVGKNKGAGVIDMTNNGLYRLDVSENILLDQRCALENNPAVSLPAWYDAHNVGDDPARREFRIVTSTPRVVTASISNGATLEDNVERAARNLAEAAAAKARDEGIFVFTLGMGSSLRDRTGTDNEKGEDVLKCMANVADGPSRCFNPTKPVGMYCYAATEADLTPCFSRLASAILRIAR
jgi:Flp pilus assembly protein TadG